MKNLIIKTVATLFSVAVALPIVAQTPAENYYGFETGKISTDAKQKKSANWWIQSNDLFSISEEQNHTTNGTRSLMYENKKKNKTNAFLCATYEATGAPIKLKKGTYRAECWIYLENGALNDIEIYFPITKFKDGKRIPEWKAAEVKNPDFESPFRSAKFNTANVEQGKWTRITTKWYFNYNGEAEFDALDSFVNIKYPQGSPKAKFHIDDIRIIKVE